MSREIKRILISTMPRSGTVFLFNFIAELFDFKKVEPQFSSGSWPTPPEWDPYKFDETYLSLTDGEVLCAHYLLNKKIRELICQDDVLTIYLYRDPRDAAVSAAMYIKYALTDHPLHYLFSEMSDAEAITFILSGGILNIDNSGSTCGYIKHGGIKYFCDSAADWINEGYVAAIRYEDFMVNPVSSLTSALQKVNVSVESNLIDRVSDRITFSKFTGGREKGVEQKASHFRKGIVGDYRNHFTPLHKAICKLRIGTHLVSFGYEKDFLW